MTMNSQASNLHVAAAIWRCVRLLNLFVLVSTASLSNAATVEELRCGALGGLGQYGPFDYRTATAEQKHLVESAHFSPESERLIRGTSQKYAGPDIDYTLRAFPNHARALKSMMELGFREKTNRPFGSKWPVDCYFNRAIRFTPDDPQVRMVYGIFLMRNGEKKGATEQLEIAHQLGASSGNFHYNLGLAYFQLKEYDKARLQAYKAKELGFELEGLKNLLTRAGQWREQAPRGGEPKAPDPAAAEPAAPQPPAPKG